MNAVAKETATEVALAPMRDTFAALARVLDDSPGAFTPPVKHYRVPGIYGRQAEAPAGSCIVSYIHKLEHITVIVKGEAMVADQDGNQFYVTAPDVFITKPGTQRVIVAITDILWFGAFPDMGTTAEDDDRMEELMVFKTFEEYEAHLAAQSAKED